MKWYNIREREDKLRDINVIIGARGIGKTYSVLDYCITSESLFIYLRNTSVQLNECSTDFGNPFKRWNNDHGRGVYIAKEKEHSIIYEDDKILGYATALSTFENLRGVDLSDVKFVIFDEFIEKRSLRFAQFETFIDFYETVNRNRELLGEEALKCFLLSNSQRLDNPILAGYGLIPIIESMTESGQKIYRNGGLYLELPQSEVSEAKAHTSNYNLIKGTKIAAENLENKFAFDSFYGIKKRPLMEYTPICMIDDIYIYKHKSNGSLYACMVQAQNIQEFSSRDNKTLFLRSYGLKLQKAAASGKLEYSDFTTKTKLLAIFM